MSVDCLDVLIVDDNEDDVILIARQFRNAGYRVAVQRVDTAGAMTEALRARNYDAIIADVSMPHFSAAGALAVYNELACDCPFIVVSGTIGEDTAVGLLKAGAHDFLPKSNLARLVPATERELRETEERRARRQAEEALRASEERYARAVNGANDGLWDWDLETNHIYYSPRWGQMLGLDADPGDQPAAWFGRIHDEDAAAVRHSLDDHLAGRTPHFAVEYRIRHADGHWRWMLARGLAVPDATGRPCRIAGSQTDISAHKQAEQQLLRSKTELEHAVAAKTRFLAAASHDLRQPVQALLCFTSLLEMQLQQHHPARSTLDDLAGSLTSLKGLLDALLDVSKLDAGVIKPEVIDVPVRTVLEQIATQMRPMAEAKGLRLRMVVSAATIRSDPILLGRILRNLVENAIRYTMRGRVLIGCRRRGDALRIEVHDSGVGIGDEARRHIFEEFFQVGNSERDRMKGLGLGLAIVNRLGHLLDHPVTVESRLGRGSSFAVSVPRVATRPAATSSLPAPAPQAAVQGTILVIDDEKMVANALAGLLRAWGFEATTASSLMEAAAVVHEAPSAIIADYRLREGRTGVEAVRALRSRFGQPIPCVVVTGDTAADRLREITDSGSMLLHKPVMPNDLRQALQTLLSGVQWDAASVRRSG